MLREYWEKYKKALDRSSCVGVYIPSLFKGFDFKINITRAEFEEINSEFFDDMIDKVSNFLIDAKASKSDIDKIILTGGSTKIPCVKEMLEDFFDQKNFHPYEDLAVYGSAILAAKEAGTFRQ